MKYIFLYLFFFSTLSAKSQKLILATYQYADNNRIANIQPLADHIHQNTGVKVETKSYPSVHQFIEAIQNNEVDIALINTFGYFLLHASSKKYTMKPYVVLQVKEGAQDNYKTTIIASRQLDIDTLNEIKKIAAKSKLVLVNPGSTSGNLIPRLALSSVGIKNPEKNFLSLSYGKNHRAALDLIIERKADIGAIGSTEYFNFIKDDGNARKIKLLWISQEIPLGPVLMHNKINDQLKDSLIKLFVELNVTNSMALEAVKNGWSEAKQAEKYIIIDKGYYKPFKKQLGDRKTMAKILKQFAN